MAKKEVFWSDIKITGRILRGVITLNMWLLSHSITRFSLPSFFIKHVDAMLVSSLCAREALEDELMKPRWDNIPLKQKYKVIYGRK